MVKLWFSSSCSCTQMHRKARAISPKLATSSGLAQELRFAEFERQSKIWKQAEYVHHEKCQCHTIFWQYFGYNIAQQTVRWRKVIFAELFRWYLETNSRARNILIIWFWVEGLHLNGVPSVPPRLGSSACAICRQSSEKPGDCYILLVKTSIVVFILSFLY